MTDEEAVQLLCLLNKYVRLPESDDAVGAMTIKELTADLLDSFTWPVKDLTIDERLLTGSIVPDPPLCYMGHEDCYDNHTNERLADEADWEHEREQGLSDMNLDNLRKRWLQIAAKLRETPDS